MQPMYNTEKQQQQQQQQQQQTVHLAGFEVAVKNYHPCQSRKLSILS